MIGLRTQEREKVNRFFKIVQDKAAEQDCVFFCDNGEGRDIITDEIEGEDLAGWLIPKESVEEFEPLFMSKQTGDAWDDFYLFAIWSRDEKGKIVIEFKDF